MQNLFVTHCLKPGKDEFFDLDGQLSNCGSIEECEQTEFNPEYLSYLRDDLCTYQ